MYGNMLVNVYRYSHRFFLLLFRYYNVLTSAKMPPTNSENGFDRWWTFLLLFTFFAAISQHTYIVYVGYSTSLQELLVNLSSTPCHFFFKQISIIICILRRFFGERKTSKKVVKLPNDEAKERKTSERANEEWVWMKK